MFGDRQAGRDTKTSPLHPRRALDRQLGAHKPPMELPTTTTWSRPSRSAELLDEAP